MQNTSRLPVPVRVVVFDLGGVVFTGPVWAEFRTRWVKRLGITPEWFDANLWYGPDIEAANIGQMTAEEFALRCARRLGCDAVDVQIMIEGIIGNDTTDALNQKLVDYIRTLRRRVRVAALTNTWAFERELQGRRVLRDLF